MTGIILLFYLAVITAVFILLRPRVYFLIAAGILGLMGFASFILGLPLSVSSGYH